VFRKFSLFCLNVVFLSISGQPAYCQNNPYIFHHITTKDGLAGNDVRGITQDSKGFIWVATNNGLQKYDGYEFINYHHNPADSESISSDNLFSLSRDNQDAIWAISFLAGFNRFDPVTNKCIKISELNDQSFRELFLPQAFCLDILGNMWLIAAKNIACFKTTSRTLEFFGNLFPKSYDTYFLDAQYDAGKNQIWIADAKNGVCMYDLEKKIFFYRGNNPDHLPIFDLPCKPIRIQLDRDHNLWIHGNDGYLAKYCLATNAVNSYYLYESPEGFTRIKSEEAKSLQTRLHHRPIYINAISSDAQGNVWFAAGTTGLLQYIHLKDSFSLIQSISGDANSLHYNSDIHCIFNDKQGNIWIGTDKGINVFNPLGQRFHFFENNPFKPLSKTRNETMDFFQTMAGDLWVATWGSGLALFDSQLKPEKQFTYDAGNVHAIAEPSNLVWALSGHGIDSMIVGYQGGRLSIVNTKANTFSHFQPKELNKLTVFNMRSDQQGNLWLALASGIGKWNIWSGEAVKFDNFIPYKGVSRATASYVLPDNSGHVWVGTLGLGLQRFDELQKHFTEIFTPGNENSHSISSAIINCMIAISDTTMAIGTGTGGIDIFNTNTRKFISISTADGLTSNDVSALYFVPPYSLWASTGSTICKVNLVNRQIISFGPQDGILDIEFSGCHNMYRLRDGRLLVGYVGGFLYFFPDSVNAGASPSNVSFTGVRIFDRALSIDSILQHNNPITLSYKQNFITIQYSALDYFEASRIKYYYRLSGVDKNWVNAGNQHRAVYTDLPGGKYIFEVKCENSDAVSSASVSRLDIVITPPFWQTVWFRVLILLSVAAAAYWFYRYRVGQLLQMQQIRNEISKDLHDDVGSTLSSISILSQVAKDKIQEGNQDQSSNIMVKINNYAQEMVEKMGDIVWAVNSRNDSIQDLIQRLNLAFVEPCISKGIELTFQCNPLLEKRVMSMQFRKNIFLICKEALNNAVKYSEADKISVAFTITFPGMEMQITDNGKGFDPTIKGRGNGLSNIQGRAMDLKATLVISSNDDGTSVVLRASIPKNR